MRRWLLAPVLPLALVLLWHLGTLGGGTPFPRPTDVVAAAGELLGSGELVTALTTSVFRVLLGFAIGVLSAAAVGIAMGRWAWVRQALDPLVETVRPIAAIALVPIAILWFGAGTNAAVFIVAYASFFPMVVNTVAGVRTIEPSMYDAARTFGLPERRVLSQVVLPAALPSLFVGARLSMGLAWTSVIAAELTVGAKATEGTAAGASGGIGQLMYTFFLYDADPNPMVVCMISVGLVGLALDQLLRGSGRLLMPWRPA